MAPFTGIFKKKHEAKYSGDITGQQTPELVEKQGFVSRAYRNVQQTPATSFRQALKDDHTAAQYRLTETEISLYQRRYTEATAQVNLTGVGQELQTAVSAEVIKHHREHELEGKGYIERKKIQEQIDNEQEAHYNTIQANAGKQFVQVDELRNGWIREHILKKKVTLKYGKEKEEVEQQELMKRVAQGDLANLSKLDPALRSMVAKAYMEKLNVDVEGQLDPESLVNALFKDKGVSALMNPVFRIGVSILMNGGGPLQNAKFANKNAAFWKEVEDLCNQRIMSATIYTGPDEPVEGDQPDAVLQNHRAQIFIAKTLLAAHLGGMKMVTTRDKVRDERPWEGGVASAFAHCSRVGFTLPGQTKNLDYFAGSNHGLGAGFYERDAATHSLKKKSRNTDGKMVEKKTFATFSGQQGFNVAVGGYGNEGIPGKGGEYRKIRNDGTCGHIFMHVQEGNKDEFSGLLIGFESDAPGYTNQTGHTHKLGNGEFASSFGGMRQDEIGDKYGGRMVDLSGIEAKVFEEKMARLEGKMYTLFGYIKDQKKGGAAAKKAEKAQSELMFMADMLSGRLMTPEEMDRVLSGDW